jgi:hypothetical protein
LRKINELTLHFLMAEKMLLHLVLLVAWLRCGNAKLRARLGRSLLKRRTSQAPAVQAGSIVFSALHWFWSYLPFGLIDPILDYC